MSDRSVGGLVTICANRACDPWDLVRAWNTLGLTRLVAQSQQVRRRAVNLTISQRPGCFRDGHGRNLAYELYCWVTTVSAESRAGYSGPLQDHLRVESNAATRDLNGVADNEMRVEPLIVVDSSSSSRAGARLRPSYSIGFPPVLTKRANSHRTRPCRVDPLFAAAAHQVRVHRLCPFRLKRGSLASWTLGCPRDCPRLLQQR